jgi:ankyrin repeat protein
MGRAPLVKVLLEQQHIDLEAKDKHDNTALLAAAAGGYAEIVKLLIDKGADVNPQNDQGQTALDIATDQEFADIVTMLKEHGAKAKPVKPAPADAAPQPATPKEGDDPKPN